MNNIDKIYPNPVKITILMICFAISVFLMIVGYEGNPSINPNLVCGMILIIAAFVFDTKTISFSSKQISVYHLFPFLNHNILWEDVVRVEVADDRYILIVLGDCPLFAESEKKIGVYLLIHRTKLIPIDLFTDKQKNNYVGIIKKFYPNIIFSKCDPV